MIKYTIFYYGRKQDNDHCIYKATFNELKLACETLSNLKFAGYEIIETYNFNADTKWKE